MGIDATWQPLQAELQRWFDAGRQAQFWLRDDDAVKPTSALERLLELSNKNDVPMTLAVVPAHAEATLAERLTDEQRILVAVHGWSHQNHAPITEKKQELGSHRPRQMVLGEIGEGVARIRTLFPQRFVPVLVPPWNRIDQGLIAELPRLGFDALSVFGPAKAKQTAFIPVVNTHVDLMDWHGTRGGRNHEELVAAIVKELQSRFDGLGEPIGILTHHLVHDEAAWQFLHKLFAIIAAAPNARWAALGELIQGR
ncbi:Polysaccharide deacetylase [Phyllobacterium sp. CL33Tsu]|uniref:polysaccharide deacetylase family protein n=1 Tax=Phyllobacterium sp. CL33Tsu TaxID=1798191 RepID=UPI0008EDECD3|nr:polysaccharide deacetylase family protein [Phyllobacterium sp. CL33Tsu]SFJ49008.1 Polysaccharide deacetylase [Phyllobacterium sp. CL33Tsu]